MRPLDHHKLGVIRLTLDVCDSLLRSITALAGTDNLEAQYVRGQAWLLFWKQVDSIRGTLKRRDRDISLLDDARSRRGSIVLIATNHGAPTVETRAAAADSLVAIRALIEPDIRLHAPPPPAPVLPRPDYRIPPIVIVALVTCFISEMIVIFASL